MKLSDFLKQKKIVFGEEFPQIINPTLNGEVVFYNLDNDRIKLINEEVIQKLNKNDTDDIIAYKMFSYLTDVENDVDIKTFVDMMDNAPNNEFALLVEEFMKLFNDFFARIETKRRTEKAMEELKTKLPEKIELPKTPQEIKKELMEELGTLQESTPENKKRRKEIFIELSELEN